MNDDGQATVEVLGLVPLLLVVVLAITQALASGSARESARAAAYAGALAIAQDQDPAAAARASVPDVSRSRLTLIIGERSVRAIVRPKSAVPGLAALLKAEARADAGEP